MEKTTQLKTEALKEPSAWPGAGQRTLVVLAKQLMAAELYQKGHPTQDCTPGASPVNGKETQ